MKPLKISQDNRRSRWLVTAKWDMLHRVSEDFQWGYLPDSYDPKSLLL
jgi:hypothetical protein